MSTRNSKTSRSNATPDKKRPATPRKSPRPAPPRLPVNAPLNVALDDDGFETTKDEGFFGEIVHFACVAPAVRRDHERTQPPDGHLAKLPGIAVAMRVRPANDMGGVSDCLVGMCAGVRARRCEACEVLVDMGYSLRKPERWRLPLSRLGFDCVFDLPKNTRRTLGTVHGAVLDRGWPKCPLLKSLPMPTPPKFDAGDEAWRAYWRAWEVYRKSLFQRLGRPSADVRVRVRCPGAAPGWTACRLPDPPNEPTSDRPEVVGQPGKDWQPLDCCNTTFYLDETVALGRRQRDVVGSPNWIRSYRRRTISERFMSAVKVFGQWERAAVRFLDPAGVTLALLFIAVATNIRLLRVWSVDTGHTLPDYETEARSLLAAYYRRRQEVLA